MFCSAKLFGRVYQKKHGIWFPQERDWAGKTTGGRKGTGRAGHSRCDKEMKLFMDLCSHFDTIPQWLVFIGSLEVFFLVKSSRALWSIKPGFQRCKPIACKFSRDKKSAERFFANTKCSRRGEAEHPVQNTGERSEPPPKIYWLHVFTFSRLEYWVTYRDSPHQA